MQTVTLERGKWLRCEEASREPYLLHPETMKYDCIGRLMLLVGVRKDRIKGLRFPSAYHRKFMTDRHQLFSGMARWLTNFAKEDNDQTIAVLALNDDPTIDDETRLSRINAIVSEFDIQYTLIDDLPPLDSRRFAYMNDYALLDKETDRYVFSSDPSRVIAERRWFQSNYGSLNDYALRHLETIATRYQMR